MICHKQKIIFIHIPKCAGSSINNFYFDYKGLDWKTPNYERLYGWCPKHKIHLQHATAKELIEMELVTKLQWDTYFKFTFVRNPWDRAYSDYLWIMEDRGIEGTFKDYILQSGKFDSVLNDKNTMDFRGDHVSLQTSYFSLEGEYKIDFIGRFESLSDDIMMLNSRLKINESFNMHLKKNNQKLAHYSHFYTNTQKGLVGNKYIDDIEKLNYDFEDLRKGFRALKKIL